MNIWIAFSILATIFVIVNDIIIKYLTLQSIDVIDFMSISGCIIGLIALLVVLIRTKYYNVIYQKIIQNKKISPLILLFSISFVFVIYGIISGIKYSPNPGYVKTIVATNALIVAIISYYLFNSHINRITILGILIVLMGLIVFFVGCPNK